MGVDHHDPRAAVTRQQRRVKSLETASPLRNSPDSQHPGSGEESIQLGVGAVAEWYDSTAIGSNAKASALTDAESGEGVAIGHSAVADGFGTTAVGSRSYAQFETAVALGWGAFAGHLGATAIGHQSVTTAAHQVMLGRAEDEVRVPGDLIVHGTFSNPSARHLKRNIVPAPSPRDVFPDLVEFEYIDGDGRRHLGYIAGDLVGTGAERFITKWDDEGRAVAIDRIGLLTAQVTALRAELAEIRDAMGGGNGRDL